MTKTENRAYVWALRVLPLVVMGGVFISHGHASIDQHLTQTSTILNGTLMKIVAGGGTLFGSAVAIFKGNFMLGLSILGCLLVMGIGMALVNADISTMFAN